MKSSKRGSWVVAAMALISCAASAQSQSMQVQKLIERGGCTSCHGEGLNAPIDTTIPKLAGQYPDFLLAAMKAYQYSANAVVGRDHSAMKAVLAQYTTQELDAMARHIAQLRGSLRTVQQRGFR